MRSCGREASPVGAATFSVFVGAKQGCSFARLRARLGRGGWVVFPGEATIVEALKQQYNIGERIVNCEDDLLVNAMLADVESRSAGGGTAVVPLSVRRPA